MSDDSKHLSDLRALAEARGKATKGEWSPEVEVDDHGFEQHKYWLIIANQPMAYEFDRIEDSGFCAAAANHDFPGLIAHLEKLERVGAAAQALPLRMFADWLDKEQREGRWKGSDGSYQAQHDLRSLADAITALETKHG